MLLLTLCSALAGEPAAADSTQAAKMIAVLAAPPAARPPLVEPVLAARGTELIVAQQNLSRRVTRDQYAEVLRAFAEGREPRLSPADGSDRARRGVAGLTKDVWPSLAWGSEHAALLRERLESIERLDLLSRARETASRFLPEAVPLSPRVFVVAGGRAGAAALDGGDIYIDVLAMSFHADRGALAHYPTPDEQVEFVAHELHHQGSAGSWTRGVRGCASTPAVRRRSTFSRRSTWRAARRTSSTGTATSRRCRRIPSSATIWPAPAS